MTKVSIEDDKLVVEVQGLDKLWALRSNLTIPLAHIANCEYKPEIAEVWYHGIKAPGTGLPGVITAGTFYKDHNKVFWDVHDPVKTIVINLHDENFNKLVVEVEDPQTAISLILDALRNHNQ